MGSVKLDRLRQTGVLFLLIFTAGLLFAQAEGAIFVPFVSKLTANVEGAVVRLSWSDSPSAQGPVFIYRSSEPFVGDSPTTRLAGRQVPYGQQVYVEEIEAQDAGPGPWYYFVAATDDIGTLYDAVVPFNNIIDIYLDSDAAAFAAGPVGGRGVVADETGGGYDNSRIMPPLGDGFIVSGTNYGRPTLSAQTPETRQLYFRGITDIHAEAIREGVRVSWNAPERNEAALLFRSRNPIRDAGDLTQAPLVAENVRSPYIDYPPSGESLYYAVVYTGEMQLGRSLVYPGANATTMPTAWTAPFTVSMPVEALAVVGKQNENYVVQGQGRSSRLLSPMQLSPEAEIASVGLRNTVPPPVFVGLIEKPGIEPRLFNEDVESSAPYGDDYDLSQIVRSSLFRKNWGVARAELTGFLSARRTETAKMRAQYYLAQCNYFLGDYKTALAAFLQTEPYFPSETAPWVSASLTKLGNR